MNVLLAESRPDVRSALRLFLELDGNDIRVTEAVRSGDLASQVGRLYPDVLLLDWEWPGLRPANFLTQIRGLFPEIALIVLSARPEIRVRAVADGADAFINKSDTPEQMMDIIKRTLSIKTERGRHE